MISTIIRFFFVFITITSCIPSIEAQEIRWNAGFLGFFNNREYFNFYTQPQTIFGSRSYGSVGLALNDHQYIAAGVNVLYEFGSTFDIKNSKPILFFSHNSKCAKLFVGSFPRIDIVKLPVFLLSDTMLYYRPNVEGIFIEFSKPWGHHNVWLDWTSRQTDTDRETFLLGGTGELRSGPFFYQHHFLMFHYAGPAIPIENDHIRDNGGFNAMVGLDLSKQTDLDTLKICSGLTFSYDRLRNIYDTRYYFGSLSQIILQYYGIGINNTLSVGQGMVQMLGDPLYKATFYNRTDFYWCFFRKNEIRGSAEFSVHVLPKGKVNYSQRLIIYMDIKGRKTLKPFIGPGI